MELRLVIFLAFTSVTLVANTMLIWFAYRGFAGVVSRVSETVTEFEKSSETAAVINSVKVAAEHARRVTELTREKLTGFEPVLEKARQDWASGLASIDTKLQGIEEKVSTHGRKIRDAVADPAFKISAVADGIQTVLGFITPAEDET